MRRTAFARGWLATSRVPVPVIVVGNVVVGGAGKTPAVLAIVETLLANGRRPGIVSSGHGRSGVDAPRHVGPHDTAGDVGDEPLLLARRAGVPVVVGRDRVAAAHVLLQADPGIDAIVADDGLQHLALARDIEVVLVDERGAGNGRLLPAGPLRERMPPVRALADARSVPLRLVLYNAPAPTTPLEGFVSTRRAAGLLPLERWWQGAPPDLDGFALLLGRPVVAACGIGRPERFFTLLRDLGLDVRPLPLADHFPFESLPWPAGTTDVVVTEKDATKLVPGRAMGARVWVAALDFRPEPAFDAALLERLAALAVADDATASTRPLSTLPLPLEPDPPPG